MGALEGVCCLGAEELGLEDDENSLAIQEAVKVLLQGLGEDINREGLKNTPLRVTKALGEATQGYRENVNDVVEGALFPEAGLNYNGARGSVTVEGLDLFSYCESCLLPFQVKCHVCYVPSKERIVGLSKFGRVSDVFAKRLQNPQRLSDEICSALYQEIKPAGVAVILHCLHIWFPNLESLLLDSNSQGVVKRIARSGSGVFENERSDHWVDFIWRLKIDGINIDNAGMKDYTGQSWCPSQCTSNARVTSKIEPPNPEMVAAVASIIRSLGEDPLRKELVETPSCYVKWLMNFQNSNLEMKLNGFLCGRADAHKPNSEVLSHSEEEIHCEMNLALWSLCEHHLLPFYGVVHMGYFCPEGVNPIGKSLLQSIVHFYGFKLQVQERLTMQIAKTVASLLGGDVMVYVQAKHMCMMCRGIKKLGSSTSTDVSLGRFRTDRLAKDAFYGKILSPRTSEGF